MKIFIALTLCALLVACGDSDSVAGGSPIVAVPELIVPEVQVIRFGVYASGNPIELVRDFNPIMRKLEEYASARLGGEVQITLVLSKTYKQGIQVIVEGTVDFARIGPIAYLQASELNPDIEILATEDQQVVGIIAIHKDSPIASVGDLWGKTFAFGDKHSSIGRYLAQLFLVNNNITAVALGEFGYFDRHDKVGKAVGRGEYVAGALNARTFRRLVASGVPIKELARFGNATTPWVSSGDLDGEIETMLREGLLQFQNGSALSRLEITGFVDGEVADFEPIRESILNNRRFFEGYTTPE
jgi:phosphonate transport system substrate-binding protein